MFKSGTILNRLYETLAQTAKDRQIADLRLGLSYVGVKLDNGNAGIAALVPDRSFRSCTVLKEAGTYAGANASDLLGYLVEGQNSLHRAIGLAVANSLIKAPSDQTEDREATTYFNLQPGEQVVMVGLFAPLVKTVGVALVSRTGSDLCRDAGEGAMASLVETAGAVIAILVSLPLFQAAWDMLRSLL